MNTADRVTKVVTLMLTLVTLSAGAEQSKPTVNFGLKMGGQQTMAPESKPIAAAAANIEYGFYKIYALGVDLAFMQTFEGIRNNEPVYKGVDDVGVYLNDSELWTNKYDNWTLGARLTLLAPTSTDSKVATMNFGAVESLNLRKGWGDKFALTYTLATTEYSYKQQKFEVEDYEFYNTRFRLTNRLIGAYTPTKSFKLETGGSLRTYNDFEGNIYSIYAVIVGMSYNFVKEAAIELRFSSACRDNSGRVPWAGPLASAQMFGSEGMIVYFGTSISI